MVRVRDRLAGWEVWGQDENGRRYLVANHQDRVSALAHVLIGSGYPGSPTLEVYGPPGPLVRTNRDLYLRLLALGDYLTTSGRALLDYLCALYAVTRPMAAHPLLDGDSVAALLTASATAPPARPSSTWLVDDLTTGVSYAGFDDFTKVLCTQIADLLAFLDHPPGPCAALGIDAPPRLAGGRATTELWCNFDPATYLECAGAGALGGWAPGDGRRVQVDSEPGSTGEEVLALEPLTWGDFAAFLEYGQSFE